MKRIVVAGFVGLLLSACTGGGTDSGVYQSGGSNGNGGAAGSDNTGNSAGASPMTGGAGGSTPGSGGIAGGSSGGSGGSATGGSPAQTGGTVTGGNGGTGGTVPGGTGGVPSDPPAGYVPAIMGVGYGGIRVLSRDNGATWTRTGQLSVDGGDDQNLFRGVAWGNGRWITAGWRYFTSPDGITWTEGKNPTGCGLMESAAFGNGIFVAICGDSSYTSTDGITWKQAGRHAAGGHTVVRFAPVDGKFVASGDNKTAFASVDAKAWTLLPGIGEADVCDGTIKTAAACGNAFHPPGVWLRSEWKARITRSTDGSKFNLVYTDSSQNSVNRFTTGWAPPK